MILTLNKSYGDFVVDKLLPYSGVSYREVYRGRMSDGKVIFLTVYDLKAMPVTTKSSQIKEFELCSVLTDDLFPRFLKRGEVVEDDRSLAWMATEYIDVPLRTLRDFHDHIFLEDTHDAFYFVMDLLKGISELAHRTHSGGHYNLNLDTVCVAEYLRENPFTGKVDYPDYRPFILDLSSASDPCLGTPPFDTSLMDPIFRARETYLGSFSTSSDIYAIGVLLAYLLESKGDCPFPVEKGMDSFKIGRIVSETEPHVYASEEVVEIIRKALRVNVLRRYRTTEAFMAALDKYDHSWSRDRRFTIAVKPDEDEEPPVRPNKRRFTGRSAETSGEVMRQEDVSYQQAQPLVLHVNMEEKKGPGFSAVAGMEALKRKLHRDFIDIVSHRDLAALYDIVPPNILLYGPPGTGKTYISMRLAEECEMDCSVVNPSDLASIYVHGSQSLIKDLFQKAEATAKRNGKGVLLVFDEFDAFCPQRTPEDRSNQAGEVAEFLVQLNNCYERNIFVVGTTNCLDRVDKAVIRKGRIDEVIFIGMPDQLCRKQILEMELNKRPHAEEIDLDALAQMTDGFTSGDITYLVKETARSSFEGSVAQGAKEAMPITQEMLETVIRESTPSVSVSEVRKYERMRDAFVKERKKEGQKVGFFV
jgi:transitional endoplasmic reticulum ATPase